VKPWGLMIMSLKLFPATSHYEKSTVGYNTASKSAKRLSPQRALSSRCRVSFFLSSMKRVSIQLFLMWLDIRSFSISLVSFGETFWLLIAFLFLDFHMAHVVMKIRTLPQIFLRAPAVLPLLLSIHPRPLFLSWFTVLSARSSQTSVGNRRSVPSPRYNIR